MGRGYDYHTIARLRSVQAAEVHNPYPSILNHGVSNNLTLADAFNLREIAANYSIVVGYFFRQLRLVTNFVFYLLEVYTFSFFNIDGNTRICEETRVAP